MTFDKLYNLLEENLIDVNKDRLIAEKIIEAETDWVDSLTEFDDFIEILEKEIGGETTKSNLKKLLAKYSPNGLPTSTWNSESVYALIEIFDLTGFSTLRKVFEDLSNRLNKKKIIFQPISFDKKGYPIIKLYDEYLEIKALDYSKYRKFRYYELTEVKLIDHREKWWFKLYSLTSLSAQIYSGDDPIKLKIFKKNGGDWEYQTSNEYDSEFYSIIDQINIKIKNTIANTI